MNEVPLFQPQPHIKLILAMWILTALSVPVLVLWIGLVGIGSEIIALAFAVSLLRSKAKIDRVNGWANLAFGILAIAIVTICFSAG